MPKNNNSSSTKQPYFLAGGGEMGRLMRNKDWRQTALGNLSEWPQSLKTTVSIVLNSTFPMALVWGEEMICFYNDAFGPSLESAEKHSPALGGKAPEVWAEAWATLKPWIDQVLDGAAVSTQDLPVRFYHHGKTEHIDRTFTFNPVRDETGTIAGVLIVCQDRAQSASSYEREKIEENDIRVRNLLEHSPVAMTLLRGPHFIIQIANQRALDLWGRTAKEVIDLPAFTAMPELADQGFAKILTEVYTTGNPFVANEYPITLIRSGQPELLYINFLYEPLRNNNGSIEGIVGVGIDVSEQVYVRKKIEESEQQLKRFKHMADHATEPFILMRKDGTFAYLNDLALQRWGYKREEIKDIRVPDVDPIYQEEKFNRVFAAAQKGKIPQFETLHKRKDGTIYPVEINMGGLMLEGEPHLFAVARDITERKKNETILAESRERFRALVNATSDVVYQMSADWSEMHTLHGRGFLSDTSKPIKGWLKKYIHPDDFERVMEVLKEAINSKGVFELEHQVIQADGSFGWTFSRAVPILNEKGEIIEWFGAATDVTKRKQAEAELRIARDESEKMKRLYEAITASTPDLIYVFDLNYRFTYANEALLAMWGQTWENAIGKGLLELGYEPWHAEMHEREIDQVVATKQSIRGEVAFPHATLGKRIYDYIFVPVINNEGEVEAVAGTTRDITEIKIIGESLKESEERFRTLADTIPNLAWMADADGWIYWYNSRWYEYTGTTPDQMEGWGWQSVHDPNELPLVLKKWKRSIATGELFDMVFLLKGADGKFRPFLTRIVPVRDEEGKVLKWFGTNTDITDRENLARQKDEFIGIASHELKTPLTSVKGYIQLIKELVREGSFDLVGDLIESSERSVNKLTGLIDDLLDVSKIQAGKIQYEYSEFPIHEILNESIREARYLSSQHEFIVEGNTSVKIYGDKLRLEQVLTNFLSNAIKYSPDADKIIISVATEANKLKVAVSDFGIGIPKRDLSNLFQRFFRADQSAHQFQGLGLGLYISAEIVKRHNGDIGAKSTVGKGSTFYFVIPIKRKSTIS